MNIKERKEHFPFFRKAGWKIKKANFAMYFFSCIPVINFFVVPALVNFNFKWKEA